MYKSCGTCKEKKLSSEFSPDYQYSDNLAWECKQCARIREQRNRAIRKGSEKKTPTSKVCSICGEVKQSLDFYKSDYSSDGLYSDCKVCHRKKVKRWKQQLG